MGEFILPARLSLFILSALGLLLVPGPAVLYIITRSVQQGRRAGIASVMGIELGNSVHVLAATLGLSALLMTSAVAFSIVKYAGAVYLVYLGLRTLLRSEDKQIERLSDPQSLWRTFRQGVIVATLNPKTALFFLAFLPQFVDSSQGQVSLQFLFLGFLFVAMGTVTDNLYALLSGTAGNLLKRSEWFSRFQRYVAGTIYILLGVTTAVTGSNQN